MCDDPAIRQHDADIGAIYQILGVVQAKQTEHDGRFDRVDGELAKLSGTVTEVLEIVREGRSPQ